MTSATLVLLCKRPALGVGKQRLAATVGVEIALQIAEALLACALEDVQAWMGDVIIAPADIKDRAWAKNLFKQKRSDVKVLPQTSGNLGQRMNALDNTLRISGFNQLIYIGSDAPDLEMADFVLANQKLLNFDIALKPTMDGGVSIMANKKPWPDLTHLPWSTSKFCDSLTILCEQNKHSISHLGQGFDVDEYENLPYLIDKLAQDKRPARQALRKLAQKITQQRTSKQKVMMQCERRYV